MTHWQDLWSNSTKGLCITDFISNVNINAIYADFYISQYITGHRIFPEYRSSFFNKSDMCFCEKEIGFP